MKGSNISLPALTSMKVFTEKSEVLFEGCGIVDNCLVTLSMGDMNGAPLAENSFVPSLVNAPLQHAKLDFGDKEIQKSIATVSMRTIFSIIIMYTNYMYMLYSVYCTLCALDCFIVCHRDTPILILNEVQELVQKMTVRGGA